MRPLALTMGEPGGIGPDITLLAWSRREALRLPAFAVFADPALLRARAAALRLEVLIEETALEKAADVFAKALPLVPLQNSVSAIAGKTETKNAAAVIEAITRAVEAAQNAEAGAVVTNPIQKATLKAVGFSSPGHTEFLADLHFKRTNKRARAVMMICSNELRTVPLTIHIPLRDVAGAITARDLTDIAYIISRALQVRFKVPRPRLVVAGLNPHAGENGTIGDEDEKILAPAIAALQKEGLNIRGPLSADTLFHEEARATYDAVIAMYHDQALIPIKTLAFDRAVNVTLGLDFIRTSPDHGTALDIAGTGKANPGSLIEALKLAAKLTSN
jgi:4-hydroxythreonine-4-phosphate dehydrogenase